MRESIFLLVAIGCSSPPTSSSPDAALDSGTAADGSTSTSSECSNDVHPNAGLQLGTIDVTSAPCDKGAPPTATCFATTVVCYGETTTGQIAVSEPTGEAKGTITTHAGGAGTGFWGSNAKEDFVGAYTSAGYRVAQVKWETSWTNPKLGNVKSGCFPATVYDWIHTNVHKGDRTKGFCGQGTSGGGASLGYSLAQYGLEAKIDYAMIVSGPAVSRMDIGCDMSSWDGKQPSPQVCPGSLPEVVAPLPSMVIDGMEGTSSCNCNGQGCTAASDLMKWRSDSVVSTTGDYAHPRTHLSFWFCGNWPTSDAGSSTGVTNGSTLGAYYYAALASSGVTSVTPHCYGGPNGPASPCVAEMVFQDPKAFDDAVASMKQECVPRHTCN